MIWSKVKKLLRDAAARTVDALHEAIGDALAVVTLAHVNGTGCSACSGGQGIAKFEYPTNSDSTGHDYSTIDRNQWRMRTTEYLPDTTNDTDINGEIIASEWLDNDRIVTYTNEVGQTILSITQEVDDSSGNITQEWATFYRYDADGRVIMVASPSAVDLAAVDFDLDDDGSYDDSEFSDLLGLDGYTDADGLRNTQGLISHISFYTSTGGSVDKTTAGAIGGYFASMSISRGENGTQITQYERDYFLNEDGAAPVAVVASDTVYVDDAGTDARTTTYSYTWYTGTNRILTKTVTHPTVSTSENGPGSSASEVFVYDESGYERWHKDEAGYLHYTERDAETGGVTIRIVDVNPSITGDFNDWDTGVWNPASNRGGGLPTALHLKTSMEVDGLGRTTKATDPNGNVDYTVYNDADQEVRRYVGFEHGKTTGPIVVSREYRPTGSGQDVYFENLTVATISQSDRRCSRWHRDDRRDEHHVANAEHHQRQWPGDPVGALLRSRRHHLLDDLFQVRHLEQ